jgi:hypothetical protein
MFNPVKAGTRKIGDLIKVIDTFNGHDTLKYTGTIAKISKTFITVKHPFGHETRFHRATGFMVGYAFPQLCDAIAPESSK